VTGNYDVFDTNDMICQLRGWAVRSTLYCYWCCYNDS